MTDTSTLEPAIGRTTDLTFDEAVERTRAALVDQSFGVLCEIDVSSTLRAKLGVELPRTLILGACHPPSAKRALDAAPEIGVLLPCNVVVRETPDGLTRVEAINTALMSRLFPEESGIGDIADEIGARLRAVIDAV